LATDGAAVCKALRVLMHCRVSPRMVTAPGFPAMAAVICGVGSAALAGIVTTSSSTPARWNIGVPNAFTEAAASPLSPMNTVTFFTPSRAAVAASPMRTATMPPVSMYEPGETISTCETGAWAM